MRSNNVYVVLLSGGSGTRLWPLSNASRSKQFLKVLRDEHGKPESMVQRTFRLIREQVPDACITVATSAPQVEFLSMQLGEDYAVSVEPTRRDTAPAILLAASQLASVQHADPSATVVVMPIDTFADPHYYASISQLDAVVQSDAARLVLLGVAPTRPSGKYGYIVPAEHTDGDAVRVSRFVEKPKRDLAISLLAKGALWNCGVFAMRLSYLLELVRGYTTIDTYDELRKHYDVLPKTSFDYAVVEHAESVAVIPYRGAWEDLGTWNALAEHLAESTSDGVWVDEESVHNVHAINETDLPMVVAGLSDATVVATPDGILVTNNEESSRIKALVERAAYEEPHHECHSWGDCIVLGDASDAHGVHATMRQLTIREGHDLPQTELHEGMIVWTVLYGSGTATVDGRTVELVKGESLQIRSGQTYTLRARVQMCVTEHLIYD